MNAVQTAVAFTVLVGVLAGSIVEATNGWEEYPNGVKVIYPVVCLAIVYAIYGVAKIGGSYG